ncbi:MAG: hypothetical protein JO347_10550 [Candidatus Eremiobacteraeota bacterium]|nr:hypothetical protein [Candidatus Eremiobacteraeota bacterium]
MTGNTPGLEAHNATVGPARPLVADTALGDVTLNLSPTDASSFSASDYILLFQYGKGRFQYGKGRI